MDSFKKKSSNNNIYINSFLDKEFYEDFMKFKNEWEKDVTIYFK